MPAKDNLPLALQHFTLEREVMFYDTDIGGVVHNLAYLRHIEEARTLMAAKRLQLDMPRMAKEQLYPVLLCTEIQYLKPASLGDTLLIQGRIRRIQRARFWVSFQILRKANLEQEQTLFVNCEQALSLVQMPDGKVQRLSQEPWLEWKRILEASEAN